MNNTSLSGRLANYYSEEWRVFVWRLGDELIITLHLRLRAIQNSHCEPLRPSLTAMDGVCVLIWF